MTSLVDLLVESGAPVPPRDSWHWGTVTATGPLRVRLDGDTDPAPVTPDSLVTVAVNDRVWCQISGRRLVILGKKV